MITLNGERGFEQVESWDQILELPGFTPDLNPSQKQLKEIIGRYVFREKIACGLSTCRQPHGRGYIVTTKSGEVTNIGNVCGKKHFGVEFEEYSKVFTQAVTDHQNREAIASFLFRMESLAEYIKRVRAEERGADWVYLTSRALVERNHGCADIIVSELGKMVRARSGDVRVARQASEDEAKELEVMAGRSLPRPQYIEESKGQLRGLSCLYPEFNIREILIVDLQTNIDKLAEVDVDGLSSKELGFWSKWCQEFDQKIDRIREAVRSGRQLLSKENLSQLVELIHDPKQRSEFKKWLGQELPK